MIYVTDIRTARTREWATLSARVRCAGSDLDGRELWFRYPPKYYEYLSSSADPWIPVLITVAMRMHRPLHVEAPASARLLEGAQTFMDIMQQWCPGCEPVPIETEGVAEVPPQRQCVGSLFSGGVDAFYTLLKNQRRCQGAERISHVLFARGFDVRLSDDAFYEPCRRHIIEAARGLDTIPIVCATNIREEICFRDLDDWAMCHGQMLIATVLATESMWRRFLVAGSDVYARLAPWGSHPLTDPLWSTESLRVVHDGCESTRSQKVMTEIAGSDVALQHLRVCYRNPGGQYNCGQCEKCIRTMVALKIAGVLDKCRSFDRPLSYSEIARIRFHSPEVRLHVIDNYKAALAAHADPLLIRALRRCVHPSLGRRFWWGVRHAVGKVVWGADRVLWGGRVWERCRSGRTPVPRGSLA